VEQRIKLWVDSFENKPYRLGADVDLRILARDYELSGGSIVNVPWLRMLEGGVACAARDTREGCAACRTQ
jgi:hypothetical protein